MKHIILALSLVSAAVLSAGCRGRNSGTSADFSVTKDIILDTDIGNSLDDLLAMDLLYHAQAAGEIRLLGVMVNHDTGLAPRTADVINTWYGYGDTPIGMVTDGVKDSHIWEDYSPSICGSTHYTGTADCSALEDAVSLYRQILAGACDSSVTILSIGFLTNLARLLDSGPDGYSELDGVELVRRKVRTVVAMCGSKQEAEYNIRYDIPSARTFFEKVPVTVSILPSEVHLHISTEDIIAHTGWKEHHPLALAYTLHNPEDSNLCWDATATLAVLSGFDGITASVPQKAEIDSLGIMKVTPGVAAGFRLLTLTDEQQAVYTEKLLNTLDTPL